MQNNQSAGAAEIEDTEKLNAIAEPGRLGGTVVVALIEEALSCRTICSSL